MKNMNNKAVTRIFTILITALLLLCIAGFVLLCVFGPDPSVLAKKEAPPTEDATYELKETFDYGEGYLRSIVFICDKTMAPICDAVETVNKDQIWTGAEGTLALDRGLSTASVLLSDKQNELPIPSAAESLRPQYIIITVGLENGVNHCTEEKFKEYYSNLINNLKNASPDTKIILQSIFPISKITEKNDPSISNDRIDTANRYIAELAEELSVKYLDTSAVLKDGNGNLDPKYDSGDGITLNKQGFEKVAEYIRTHGYQ